MCTIIRLNKQRIGRKLHSNPSFGFSINPSSKNDSFIKKFNKGKSTHFMMILKIR